MVETVEVAARLGEVDAVNAGAGLAFRRIERGVRAVAGRLEVDDRALDDALCGARAEANDVKAASPGQFADKYGHLVRTDFNRTDDSAFRDHDELWSWRV